MLRRMPSPLLLLAPWVWSSCTSPTDDSAEVCGLTSTVQGYAPECAAVLALFPSESRLQVDGRLVAHLPADPLPETQYGGISGNPLAVLLDEELAVARESTLTLGPDYDSARLELVFDSGEVQGVVFPTVVDPE